MRGRTLLLYTICCLIWGSTWLVIKIGLADLPAFRFAGWRMAIACAVLTPMVLRRGFPKIARSEWRAIAVAGFLQIGFSYALVFEAEKTIDSGLTAVIFASFPIWVGVFAHLLLPGEPLTTGRILAIALGLAGVGVLEAPALKNLSIDRRVAIAALLPLGSAIASAFSNVWIKKRLGQVSAGANLWGETLVGSLFLLSLSAIAERGEPAAITWRSAGSLLYLSLFGTVAAFLALFWLIPRVPMSSIGAIPLIDTLIAVALGCIFLHEPVTGRLFAGGGLILSGAFLAGEPVRSDYNRIQGGPKA